MKLDARLQAAADAAGRCALFADIGSDHAKLALYLLETGAAARAVCADIHAAPLARGQLAAARAGLAHRAAFVLSDGLDALPERPDVAAVCGMGGELIADIVARALRRFPGGPPVRFVLQPMTAVSELRRYLWESGFTIADERYAVAAGKPYVILTAVYGASSPSCPPLHMTACRGKDLPPHTRDAAGPGKDSRSPADQEKNPPPAACPPADRRTSLSPNACQPADRGTSFSPNARQPADRENATAFSPSSASRNSCSAERNSCSAERNSCSAERNSYSYTDLYLGKIRPPTPAYRAYVRRVCAAAEKRLHGLYATGGDPANELLLLREAGEWL